MSRGECSGIACGTVAGLRMENTRGSKIADL